MLDVQKYEFKDTWLIGEDASYINILDVAFAGTKIYAASDEGLYNAVYDLDQLWNYENWSLVSELPDSHFPFNLLRSFNGNLFANQINPATGNDTLFVLHSENWSIFPKNLNNLKSISDNGNQIIFTSKDYAKVYDKNLNQVNELNWYAFSNTGVSTWTSMNYGMLDNENNFIIADNLNGMVYRFPGSFLSLYPNGPFNNATAKIETAGKSIITTCGNATATAYYSPIYNVFKEENWSTFLANESEARNLFSIAVHPDNNDNIFIGSWGYGLFEFLNNVQQTQYTLSNSTLQAIEPYGYGFIRISDLTFDLDGNLWICNPQTGEPVSVMTPDRQWKCFNFNGIITNNLVDEIFVTDNNMKWIIQDEGNGILILDDKHTPLDDRDDTYKKIIPVADDGESFGTIYDGIQDKNGEVWLTTDKGIIIYYNPEDVFDDNFIPDRVQLTSYGNDTTEQYLLGTDIVTDIEIDGANRKWLATQNSGAFLVSENGKKEILHFDIYNSPLISNTINDLAIDPVTGEVYFLTEKGIMSFRGDATEAGEQFGQVYVFPNPVRPGYTGKITVTGLAANVNVKITDISGCLVYETQATGGQAVWDGLSLNGRRVNSGVYLVFCTNEDGSETFVTKFLFLN